MRSLLNICFLLLVLSCSERSSKDPPLEFIKVDTLTIKTAFVDRGKNLVTIQERYLLRNYFRSDTTAIKEFVYNRVSPSANDSLTYVFSFYKETDILNVASIKKNIKTFYENDSKVLRQYEWSGSHLLIYTYADNGDLSIRSETLK